MYLIVPIKSILYLEENLPLVFELKRAGLMSKCLFVVPGKETYDYIAKNAFLCDAITSISGKLICVEKYGWQWLNVLRDIVPLRKYLSGRVTSLEPIDHGVRLVSVLADFNRKFLGGKRICSMILNRPFRVAKRNFDYYRAARDDFERRRKTIKNYDCIAMLHTKKEYEEIYNMDLLGDFLIVQTGFTRGLKAWRDFIDQNGQRYLPDNLSKPYFLFNLNRTGRWITGENSIASDELLKESLHVLRKFNREILTVFKPHNNTDVSRATEILQSVNYQNYVISYCHPWVLMKDAKFVFSYTASSISGDAYYLGCPTVEYGHYDPRFTEKYGSQSLFLECVDYFVHRDVSLLERVIGDLVSGNVNCSRDREWIASEFPVLSPEEIRSRFEPYF